MFEDNQNELQESEEGLIELLPEIPLEYLLIIHTSVFAILTEHYRNLNSILLDNDEDEKEKVFSAMRTLKACAAEIEYRIREVKN